MSTLTAADQLAVPAVPRPRRRLGGPLRKGNRIASFFLAILIVGVLASFTVQWWWDTLPSTQVLRARLTDPVGFGKGTWTHPLGTDELGRDILTRIIYGGRVSYLVGFVAATAAAVIGILLGILAGYRRGVIETVVLRVVDVLTAFPFLVVAITVVALVGPSLRTIIVTLIIWEWVPFTRLAHARTLSVKQTDYFVAAVATGRRPVGIALRHVLPNIAPPLMVIWTSVVARAIVIESSLSFLGLGVPPPTPTWGGMLAAGRQYLDSAWWIPLMPGFAIVLVVVAVNVVGAWLAERWDPRDN